MTRDPLIPNLWNIRQLYENKMFEIPVYQRPYSWDAENVTILLNDILNSFNERKTVKSYYTGNVIIRENDTKTDGNIKAYDIIDGTASPSLGVHGADMELLHAGPYEGARAHAAGLHGHVHLAADEPPAPQDGSRLPDRQHLRMGRRILHRLGHVMPAGDDPAILHDDSPHRDLTELRRDGGLGQGFFHESIHTLVYRITECPPVQGFCIQSCTKSAFDATIEAASIF